MSDRLVSRNGKYATVQQDDGGLVTYRRDPDTGLLGEPLWSNGIDEIPNPPPLPTPPIIDPLVIDGDRFLSRRTGDRWIYRGITAFRIVDQVASGQVDDAVAYMDWARAAEFNVLRVLSTAKNSFIDLTPGQGQAALPIAFELAAERGLYLEVVGLSDTAVREIDWLDHARQVAVLCHAHAHAFFELINEPGHDTHLEIFHDMAFVQAAAETACADLDPLIWSAGTSPDDEAVVPSGRYVTRHLDRSRDPLNQVRRVKELAFEVQSAVRAPVLNDEPTGADEQPGAVTGKDRINEPWFFYAMGALQAVFGIGGTFHLEAGLTTVIPGTVQHACAAAWTDGMRVLEDREHGLDYFNAGHDGSPVRGADFEDPGDGPVIRAYSGLRNNGTGLTIVLHRPLEYDDAWVEWDPDWTAGRDLSPYPFVRVFEVTKE